MKPFLQLFSLILLSSSLHLVTAQEVTFRNRSFKNALLIAKYEPQITAGNLAVNFTTLAGQTFLANVIPEQLNLFISNQYDPTIDPQKLQKEIEELRRYDAILIAQLRADGTPPFSAAGDALRSLAPSAAFQSMVVDAVAKLVAEQFQESVSTVYLNRLREQIGELKGLPQLLPKTYELLQRGNFFRFKAIGQEFRSVFEEDLKELPAHLKNYLALTPTDQLPPPFKNMKQAPFYSALHFSTDAADKLIHGYTPAQLLDYLAHEYQNKANYVDYYRSVELINIVQKNLQDEDKIVAATVSIMGQKRQFQNIWLDFGQLQQLKDPKKNKYFLGLIYQDNQGFFDGFTGGTPAANALAAKILLTTNLNSKLTPALTILIKINALLEKESISADDYNLLMQHCLTLLELANELPFTPPFDSKALAVIRNVVDIHKGIIRKDYAQVIPNVIVLFDLLPLRGDSTPDPDWVRLRNVLTKYGPLIAGVVAAENSGELKDVLKKAVLPNGSYIAKRISLSSLTVVAHPGLVFGAERLYKKVDGKLTPQGEFQGSIGFTAPIGLEFTWGIRQKGEPINTMKPWEKHRFVNRNQKIKELTGSYVGLMLQIADIGAVVNYRLNDPDKELPAQITFKQIFSPGLSIQLGFPNTPITAGLGVQYTPALRQLSESSSKIDLNAFRIQARITWDLPLVNIYTRTEKK